MSSVVETPGTALAAASHAGPGTGSDMSARASRPRGNRLSLCVTGLFVLGAIAFIYFGKPFLLPVLAAVLAALALRPVVRVLAACHIPEWLAALIVVLITALAFGAAAFKLSEPATEWLQRGPSLYQDLDRVLRRLNAPMATIDKIAQTAEKAAQGGGAAKPAKPPPTHPIDSGIVGKALLLGTWSVVSSVAMIAVVFVLLYFLLAAGDHFLRATVRAIPRLRDRMRVVTIARTIERDIGKYLLALSAINVGIGIAVTAMTWVLGLPNPPLWGAMAAVLHFVPYLGASVSMLVLTAVALVTLPDVGMALVVPLVYLAIAFAESQVVQPLVFGRGLSLNPVVVFVSLLFWTWIWGIPGAVVAVPMLIVAKVTCDNVEQLEPFAALLGTEERDAAARDA